jgi:uncharacterized protein
MTDASDQQVTSAVQRWLEQVVIGLQLCPFASRPVRRGQVRLVVSRPADEEELLGVLREELVRLANIDVEELETTLIILPELLRDFWDYQQFLPWAEQLLRREGWEGHFQIASFHPDYCFAGSDPDDPENLTNRTPFPILHLLREDSLEKVLGQYPDAEAIPERNQVRVRALTAEEVRELFPYVGDTL